MTFRIWGSSSRTWRRGCDAHREKYYNWDRAGICIRDDQASRDRLVQSPKNFSYPFFCKRLASTGFWKKPSQQKHEFIFCGLEFHLYYQFFSLLFLKRTIFNRFSCIYLNQISIVARISLNGFAGGREQIPQSLKVFRRFWSSSSSWGQVLIDGMITNAIRLKRGPSFISAYQRMPD